MRAMIGMIICLEISLFVFCLFISFFAKKHTVAILIS